MPTKITFGLSVNECQKAIKEIEEYKARIKRKSIELAERLASEGVYVAQGNIVGYSAIDSGVLVDSIEMKPDGTGRFIVYTDCPYAQYIEFGFGVVGQGQPHPSSALIGWKYDVNAHGERGWFYMKNGSWHWSKGQPSKPFMWQTAIELRNRIQEIATDVFRGV